jgi:hypothetical protein
MSQKKDFRNRRKVVTFELVHRSVEDPLTSDPRAPTRVLRPVYKGADVSDADFEKLAHAMGGDPDPVKPPTSLNPGIGAQFNKYFVDFDDDETDYSQFFKPINESAEDGVFISPDGVVHELKEMEPGDADIILGRGGFSAELFGAEIDPSMPRLVDDTANPLASGIDPEVLLAMDDEDVDELEDDFISKALELENGPDLCDDEEEEQIDKKSGKRQIIAKSRVSEAPSHMSRISHRSEAMDMVEERVEHLLSTVYGEEEQEEEEEEDEGPPVDWNAVCEDFKKFVELPKMQPSYPKPAARATSEVMIDTGNEEEESKEEEEKEKPKEKEWDCQSQIDTFSTTENRPHQVRDAVAKKRAENAHKQNEMDEIVHIVPPDMHPKPGESKEDAKARRKAVKEYQRQRRQAKKEMKEKFSRATVKVKKSIAASGGARGQRVIPLD